MNQNEHGNREIETLEYIYSNPDRVKQRDLADIAGVSLGMINAIIKRLARKGWLMIRKVNNRNVQYIVSPAGIEAIAKRSYSYFKRTIKNVVIYRDAVENLVTSAKRRSFEEIVLVGESGLDFIIEHMCLKHQIRYTHGEKRAVEDQPYIVFAEEYLPGSGTGQQADRENCDYLSDILMSSMG